MAAGAGCRLRSHSAILVGVWVEGTRAGRPPDGLERPRVLTVPGGAASGLSGYARTARALRRPAMLDRGRDRHRGRANDPGREGLGGGPRRHPACRGLLRRRLPDLESRLVDVA